MKDAPGMVWMRTHSRVSPEEAVRQRHSEVEVHHAQDAHLHLQQLAERVRAVADVQEVVHQRGDALLQIVMGKLVAGL